MDRLTLIKDYYYDHIESITNDKRILSALRLKFNSLMQIIVDLHSKSESLRLCAANMLAKLDLSKVDESLKLQPGTVKGLIVNYENYYFKTEVDNDETEE